MLSVRKTEKTRDEISASVGGGGHTSHGGGHMLGMAEAKKLGDIFTASGGIEPGRSSGWGVELGHWTTPVLSLEIRHNIYHYCSTSSPAPVRSCPGPGRHPPPLCARHSAAVCRCGHAQQPRGIWRGLYMERRTVRTHQVHGRTQASASLKKYTSS
jgi:hypothetical protein